MEQGLGTCLNVEAFTSSIPSWSTLSVVLEREEEFIFIFLYICFLRKNYGVGLLLIIVMVFCFAVPVTCIELKLAKTFDEELVLEEANGESSSQIYWKKASQLV